MSDVSPELVAQALAGDRIAVDRLIRLTAPVVHARVARILLQRSSAYGRDGRQDVEDLVQDVYVALFEDGGRLLKMWAPKRGMSLKGFVGLIAEQRVAATLRSKKRNPWTDDPTLDAEDSGPAKPADKTPLEQRLWARDQLARLLDSLRAELSPRGLDLFYRLLVHQEPIESVMNATGMSRDALYAWRSRLRKLVKRLAQEMSEDAA